MSDLNIVCICGRLTMKPELKHAQSGTAICSLSIANNVYAGKGKDKDKVNFFNVTVFGARGENCDKYLDKGSQVVIDGRLDWSSWETQEGQKRTAVKIIGNNVQFIGGKKKASDEEYYQEGGEQPEPTEQNTPNVHDEQMGMNDDLGSDPDSIVDDGDIPF